MPKQNVIQKTETLTDVVTTDTSLEYDLKDVDILSIQAVLDVNTPAAKVFTAAASDVCTASAHGFTTGLKGQASTTTTLPAGLSAATDYFVIVLTANTFKLATSLANALAGTAIDITDAGTGDHTFTPTSIAGGSIKLQKSNDRTNWSDEGSATNVTADSSVWLEKDRPGFRYARVYLTLTAGRMSASVNVLAKS